MTKDPQISVFLSRALLDEIVPQVPLPESERRAYAATILERFANPFIRHELLSIALNSVSKWRVRVLPTIEDRVRNGAPAPDGLAFSLAALFWFYRGEGSPDGLVGQREEVRYPIRDDAHVLDVMASAWANAAHGDAPTIARRLMADVRLWDQDLTKVGDLAEKVETAIAAIENFGLRGALDRLFLARPGPA